MDINTHDFVEAPTKEEESENISDMGLGDSILSEPPHIRNWFPSYLSPVQTVDSQGDSDSIVSEPPHIRNWFPSYMSPVQTLDSSEEFILSDFGSSETTKITETRKDSSKVKDIYVLYREKCDMLDLLYPTDADEEKTEISTEPSPTIAQSLTHTEPSTTSSEEEVIALKNRVKYLESVVRSLHAHIDRLIRSID